MNLLYTMEDVAVYGYITPLKVKIIIALALTDAVVRDADVLTVRFPLSSSIPPLPHLLPLHLSFPPPSPCNPRSVLSCTCVCRPRHDVRDSRGPARRSSVRCTPRTARRSRTRSSGWTRPSTARTTTRPSSSPAARAGRRSAGGWTRSARLSGPSGVPPEAEHRTLLGYRIPVCFHSVVELAMHAYSDVGAYEDADEMRAQSHCRMDFVRRFVISVQA